MKSKEEESGIKFQSVKCALLTYRVFFLKHVWKRSYKPGISLDKIGVLKNLKKIFYVKFLTIYILN